MKVIVKSCRGRPRQSWFPCWVLLGALWLLLPANRHTFAADDPLTRDFMAPPDSVRPYTLWHWMNGHISRDGITRDLEAMRAAGLSGFILWNTSEGIPPGPTPYRSRAWWDMFRHAAAEAKRLNLKMGIHNCAGWSSSGGPWVTPDLAMQEVVWTERCVTGPADFNDILDIPAPALGLERDMKRDPEINRRYYVPREQVRGFYRDIALWAFRTPDTDMTPHPFRLQDGNAKAGFSKLKGGFKMDVREANPGECIDPQEMINLTSKLSPDGRLQWKVPLGQWTLLRMGHQPTGRQNHPAPVEGRGLEIDKMSASAMAFHWRHSVEPMLIAAREATGLSTPLYTVHIDSFEVGHQNWNRDFADVFMRQRGYDPIKYLPTLTGRIVKSVETTERFLWDFRKTIGDMIAQNYYGACAKLCEENGLAFTCEPYGHYGNTDDFNVAGKVDVPMTEWWAFQKSPYHNATARLVASTAHTRGNVWVVDSEAFTGQPKYIFEEHPGSMKAQGDFYFCEGINRFNLHTFAHDPYGYAPGLGLGSYGSHFDTRNTWWPYAHAWLTYIARCQHLLRQGIYVADLLYFAGEDTPQECAPREKLVPVPPKGLQSDFCDRDTLERITVRHDGQLMLPNGMRYRILILPPSSHMRPMVLRTIMSLVRAGAIMVGPRPVRTPGLEGGVEAERELRAMADQLWGHCDGRTITRHKYGKGYVCWGYPLEQLCEDLGLLPDVSFQTPALPSPGNHTAPSDMEFIHRQDQETHIYFISNQLDQPRMVQTTFRLQGVPPEVWHPDTGSTEQTPAFDTTSDGRTLMTLRLDPFGSVFVIFRPPVRDDCVRVKSVTTHDGQPAPASLRCQAGRVFLRSHIPGEYKIKTTQPPAEFSLSIPSVPPPHELPGPWTLAFPSGSGAPTHVTIASLGSWTTYDDPNIKYFSGTGVYTTTVDIPSERCEPNYRLTLDLGTVDVIAEVYINNIPMGVLWKKPYAVEVTHALRPGRNRVEVRVANTWVNRLIGDSMLPDDCEWTTQTGSTAPGMGLAKIPDWIVRNTPRPSPRKAFAAWQWPHIAQKQPLSSGLIGPVRLLTEVEVAAPIHAFTNAR